MNTTKRFIAIFIVLITIVTLQGCPVANKIIQDANDATIDEANRSADESDARSVMMAASIAAVSSNPPSVPTSAQIEQELTDSKISTGIYTIYFDGPVAVGCSLTGARSSGVSVGNTDSTFTTVIYTEK